MDDVGAKKLIAGILKKAYEDYTETPSENNIHFRDARKFLHSAWCATLCDGLEIDKQSYIDKNIDKCRLTKNVTRFIVGELRAFEANKKIINGVKNDIILASAEQNEVRSSSPGDSTLSKVIQIEGKIYSDKQLRQMQTIVNAIQLVYNRLDNNRKELIDKCFFKQRYTLEGMAYKLNISRATAYNWKTEIIREIAIELGYL